jgi:hypothetical protein
MPPIDGLALKKNCPVREDELVKVRLEGLTRILIELITGKTCKLFDGADDSE